MKSMKRTYLLAAGLAMATLAGVVGCHSGVLAAGQTQDQGPDPADRNMAPLDGTTSNSTTGAAYQQPAYSQQAAPQSQSGVVNESQQQATQYQQTGQTGAPIERRAPSNTVQDQQGYAQEDQAYDELLNNDQDSTSGQPLEADQPPPPLPQYDQPEAPAPDYLWTPGYWGYTPVGYYWVPGVWCAAPYQGALWTPGYWGYYGNRYRFHRGFWGQYIGFYGGINYGFGYYGSGYRGGYWNGPHFYYNRSVNRINTSRISYVYSRNVMVNNFAMNRVSYNGGRGGIGIRPQRAELAAMRQPRLGPMSTQVQLQRQSSENRQQFFNQNRGRPAIVAAPRPIMADRGVQRPTQVPFNRSQQGGQQQNRPGQGGFQSGQNGQQVRPGQVGQQPGQNGQQQTRPGQSGFQQGQGGTQPGQNGQQNRPGQTNQLQVQPGQQSRPEMPQGQSNARPAQGNSMARPAMPEQVRPQQQQLRATPQDQGQQQIRQQQQQVQQQQQIQQQQQVRQQQQFRQQQQEARPQQQEARPQQQQQARPQQEMRQEQARPQQQQQARPQPQQQQMRQQESRPAQQSRPAPQGEGRPR
jgi:hypothetical protein